MWPWAPWLVAVQTLVSTGQSAVVPAVPCAEVVARQRAAWRVVGPPRPQPPGVGGESVRHWPTDTLGVWVVETAGVTGATSLQRVTSAGTTAIVWSPSCQATTTAHPRRPLGRPAFNDVDLGRLLNEHPQGIIYIWSPHMPLSIEGVTTIRNVGTRLHLPVTVLLDPNADSAFADTAMAARGWHGAESRVVDSTELAFRDVLVHAPSMQAYAGGRLVGSPYPGYHTVEEYGAFLERVLSTRQ